MNNQLINTLISTLNRNPNFANNPRAQEMLGIIQNGDSKRGEQIANNLCSTYGVTKEEALRRASSFFHV